MNRHQGEAAEGEWTFWDRASVVGGGRGLRGPVHVDSRELHVPFREFFSFREFEIWCFHRDVRPCGARSEGKIIYLFSVLFNATVVCNTGDWAGASGSWTGSIRPTAPVLSVSLRHIGCGNVALACER